MDSLGPAPGWERLWCAHQKLLSRHAEQFRAALEHAGPQMRILLKARHDALCEPIIRALREIPMASGRLIAAC